MSKPKRTTVKHEAEYRIVVLDPKRFAQIAADMTDGCAVGSVVGFTRNRSSAVDNLVNLLEFMGLGVTLDGKPFQC